MMLVNLIPLLGTLFLAMELLSSNGDKGTNRFGERPSHLPVSFSYFVFVAVYSIFIAIVFVFAVGRIDIVLNEENLNEEKIVRVGTNAFPIIQEAIDSLRLLLAIRLYQQEKGQLPEKLEELVPFAIDKLPMDPLDGKPMRWSKESELIYSIGSYDSEKEAIGACVKNSRRARGRTAFLSCSQEIRE